MLALRSSRRTYAVSRQLLALFLVFLIGIFLPGSPLFRNHFSGVVLADSTPQTLPFTQDWTNTGLITANDNWSGVPGIEGYLGQDITTSTGTNPQTLLGTSSVAGDLTVLANQTSTTISNGDVAEFHTTSQTGAPGTNPTIALQGSGTADAPYLLLYLNTTGQSNINVSYNLRDIDCTTDNAQQQVALQYRVGNSGNFTDLPAGYVSDATTGPSLCTAVTPISVTLPAAAENQSLVQVRIITTNAAGNDEWVGVDDISITAGAGPVTPTLSINDVAQAETNSGTTAFTFTVSLTSAAGVGGVTFNVDTADGTAQDGTPGGEDNDYVAVHTTGSITAGNTSTTVTVQVNGDTTPEPNETFFVNISNISAGATAGDTQGQGTINNDDVTLTPIYTIQGSGSTSPFNGQSVTTSGIVTGIKAGSSGGFFIQDPTGDGNTNTSDGVFIFTGSSVPAGVVIGNSVQVTGTVSEFVFASDPNSPPITEISSVTSTVVLSTGNSLPAPHVITAAETTAPSGTTNPLDSLEEFEGMRVSVPSMTVVAPTQGTITEPSATVSSSGVFYGVVTGVARPFREPGVNISDPLPAGAPASVPRFDENPERIRVDSNGQPGAAIIDVTAGTVITNVVGPLDYSFRTYTILPDAATPPTVGTLATATPVPVPTSTEFTVASFNMERFFDTANDPSTGDPVLTPAAFDKRLNKASLIIRNVQRYPDVIGVEEMENLSTLQAVANKVNTDAVSIDGIPNPNYQAYLVEGNDIGGIDVGFLVKASRVNVVDVTQIELAGCNHVTASTCYNYTNPNDGSLDILNDRPPLVLRATIARPGGGTLPFTVIVNHLRSLSGIDDATPQGSGTVGARVREKRRKQAEFLANYIQSRQVADPTEKIISVGDYNAFNINDGYVDVIGTIKGTPTPPNQVVLASSDLVNPDLINLVDTLTPDQRYSYTFDGNAQVLDQILVNPAANAILTRFAYARDDADFPVKYYEDGTRPERISDHDQPVAYFTLNAPNAAPVANNQSVTTDQDTPVSITLTGSDAENDPLTFTVVTNPSHGMLSGTAPNLTYTPDPGYSGPDSFTFKVNDGHSDSASNGTVSITVTSGFHEAPTSELLVGLTATNRLVTFNSSSPNVILSTAQITGLINGEGVIGIDFRPATNELYGFTNYNRLVTLNPTTGQATAVATLSFGLAGNEYGMDFNPTNDRLRLVNDTDQNASVDPTNGVVTLQTPLNPGNPNIVGIAYTNNVAGASSTTLYDIDSNTDTLYTQNPPASGTLSSVGALGVNTNQFVGFDISGASGVAYASLTSASNVSSLYTINLSTGQATRIRTIGDGLTTIRDVTVSPLQAPNVYGVTTSNQLITFNSARPNLILSSAQITGLLNGEIVLGIDVRPANNQLYGFTSYNRIVTLNPATGAATVVGSPNSLAGNEYGFDFNPMADRIRIVNDLDQNVRVNPDTGATDATDPNLAYAAGDPNAGQNPNITGAAYTNNVTGATSTTLYDIDSNLDILVTQGSPNGTPTSPNTGQLLTVGPLGVNTNGLVGFDIAGASGVAYASLSTPFNVSSFYAINLSTGAATLIGPIGSSPTSVRDIAISTVPAPNVIGLTPGNNLVTFNSLSPNIITSTKPITGLLNGEAVIGIDYRPATGQLYGYTGYNRLVVIDPTTGAATVLGAPASLSGIEYGFDFNPVADRLRIVNDNDQNIRVNPNDGTLAGTDTNLAYAPGDVNSGQNPFVVGAAYTNNFAGATSTTLYDIDSNLDILVTQGSANGSPTSPNTGQLFTVGQLGFNTSALVGFDIASASNAAYAALQPASGGFSGFYSINLSTGKATLIGQIGGVEAVRDIAIVP